MRRVLSVGIFGAAVFVGTLTTPGGLASAESISCGITEVTFTTGGQNVVPSLSGDGTRIAFVSNPDLTGGNADGNPEVFLYDTATNSFAQVTDTTGGGGNVDPSISGDGTQRFI